MVVYSDWVLQQENSWNKAEHVYGENKFWCAVKQLVTFPQRLSVDDKTDLFVRVLAKIGKETGVVF